MLDFVHFVYLIKKSHLLLLYKNKVLLSVYVAWWLANKHILKKMAFSSMIFFESVLLDTSKSVLFPIRLEKPGMLSILKEVDTACQVEVLNSM